MILRQAIALFVLLILPLVCNAEPGYDIYHQQINNAERCMFLKNNYDSARYYYNKAFTDFDFCFVKDCIIAAELAALFGDDKSCIRFLIKGYENGLKLNDFDTLTNGDIWPNKLTVFVPFLSNKNNLKVLKSSYPKAHQKYLGRINKPLRQRMNEIYILDQTTKNNTSYPEHPELEFVESRFEPVYDSIIKAIGYPGERLIGIDDTGIMSELGMPEEDLLRVYDHRYAGKEMLYNVNRSQFTIDRDFGAHTNIVPLLHNSCSYRKLQPIFLDEIRKGNLHPRDAAYLYDFDVLAGKRPFWSRCRPDNPKIPYFLNRAHMTEEVRIVKYECNEKRTALYLVPLEVDIAKHQFGKEHKLVLYFGFADHL